MEKSLLINHDWQGNVPVYLSRTKNNFYSISFRVSPTSGDLIVEVDAPFYDDPPPLARPQQSDGLAQNLFKVPPTPHSPPPSVPSTLIRSG